jgi:AmiR/NasT family two-component response regulator
MSGEITIAPPIRIIAADHQADWRVHYQSVLPALGYKLLTHAAGTGRELIEQCRQHRPDLVIADCKLPDVDVVDAAEEVCRARRVPFIVTADHFDPQQIRRSGAEHFWAYLMKPINRGHLEAVIPFVLGRFKKVQAFLQELESLRLQSQADDADVTARFSQVEQERGLTSLHEGFGNDVARWEQVLRGKLQI